MKKREVFYTGIALVLIGPLVHNTYSPGLMFTGIFILFALGTWHMIATLEGDGK